MRRFLRAAIACLLAGGLLGALGHRLNANLALAPTTSGAPSLTSIARVTTPPIELGERVTGPTFTVPYTTTSSTNTALVVSEVRITGGGTVALNTLTYNAISCVSAGAAAGAVTAGFQGSMWVCPITGTTGANNLIFTYAGTISKTDACVTEYTGVAQTSMIEGFQSINTSNVSPLTVNVTTAVANDWIIGYSVGQPATHSVNSPFLIMIPPGPDLGCSPSSWASPVDSNSPLAVTTTALTFGSTAPTGDQFLMAFGLKHG